MLNESLRASDFQEAWPHAYQRAMGQVADLQRGSDYLLAMLKICICDCRELSAEMNLINLATIEKMSQKIQLNAAENENKMSLAIATLTNDRKECLMQQSKWISQIERSAAELAAQRKSLIAAKESFGSLPIWMRLWLAICGRAS